jgi:hypothetical protein
MERHEILEAMTELKLYGMRASFDEVAGKGLTRRDEKRLAIHPATARCRRPIGAFHHQRQCQHPPRRWRTPGPARGMTPFSS